MASIGEAREELRANLMEIKGAADKQAAAFGEAHTAGERRNTAGAGMTESARALIGHLTTFLESNQDVATALQPIADSIEEIPGRAGIEPDGSNTLNNEDFRATRRNADYMTTEGKDAREKTLALTGEASEHGIALQALLKAVQGSLPALEMGESTQVDTGSLLDAAGVAVQLSQDAESTAVNLDSM
jgi:hypothetical protein